MPTKNRGPYITQKTYRKRLDQLNFQKQENTTLCQRNKELRTLLESYYTLHNRHFRCDCGHCCLARRLCQFEWKPMSYDQAVKEHDADGSWFKQTP